MVELRGKGWKLRTDRVREERAIGELWRGTTAGLRNPATAFGPEWEIPRPREGEEYYQVLCQEEGDEYLLGAVFLRFPAPTTVTFGLGLVLPYRKKSWGPRLRDLALRAALENPSIHKVETEIYSSNQHSWGALHEKHGRMQVEGIQKETIEIEGQYFDRYLLGLQRKEWEEQERECMLRSD